MLTARDSSSQTSITALWIALVAFLTVGGSFVFACVAPLAAIAAVAALTVKRGESLALVIAAWLANQIVGFALLSYPMDVGTIGWGIAIGLASICACLAAGLVARARPSSAFVAVGAFLASFVAYQASLYAYGVIVGDTGETFTPAMIGNIFLINAVGFVGFIVLHRVGVALSIFSPVRNSSEAIV